MKIRLLGCQTGIFLTGAYLHVMHCVNQIPQGLPPVNLCQDGPILAITTYEGLKLSVGRLGQFQVNYTTYDR